MSLDPNRCIEEKCEFCGGTPLIRWYDPCCEKQYQKYLQECRQRAKEVEDMEEDYNQSLEIKFVERHK